MTRRLTQPAGTATQRQAAAFLQISPRTLRRWESEGDGPPRVGNGTRPRYSWDALRAWAAGPAGQAHQISPS
jgi:hypothetical protein